MMTKQLQYIGNHIRITDEGDHIVAGLQFGNGLVEFKDTDRPWRILEVDMSKPAHDALCLRSVISGPGLGVAILQKAQTCFCRMIDEQETCHGLGKS
jgi:hypothetical protein